MEKVFRIEDLDCAHCAARMEEKIAKTEGVASVEVNFLAQTLTLEASEEAFDEVLAKVLKICHKVEPDCRVIVG